MPTTAWSQGVRVRARTNLWAEISEHDGHVRGYLSDDVGERLSGRHLSIRSEDVVFTTVTERDGEFETPFPLGLRSQNITVSFGGDEYHEASSLVRQIDPSRLPVQIQLILPTVVSLADPIVEAQVLVTHDRIPIEVDVELSATHLNESLGTGRTGADGWTSISFDPRTLGRPGLHHILVEYGGNEHLAPAMERAEVIFVDISELTLSASPGAVLPEETVRFSGRLLGVFAPLPGQEITLEVESAILKRTMTDQSGSFVVPVKGLELPGDGQRNVVARYRSQVKLRRSSESQPVSVVVRQPQPLAWELVVIPALVTASLFIVIILFTRRRSPRRDDTATRPSLLPPETGLRKSLVPHRTMRRVEHYDFTGRVVDPIEGRPVRGAKIWTTSSSETPVSQSDAEGAFHFGPLERGEYEISISADGYVTETFTIKIPHGGSYSGATVNIIQIRHRALEIYRGVTKPLLPRQTLWGKWTPREVAVHSVKTHPWLSDDIAEITSFFEGLYYSPTLNGPDDLERIHRLASRLRRTERDRNGADSTDG